jgi:hypothetical protein
MMHEGEATEQRRRCAVFPHPRAQAGRHALLRLAGVEAIVCESLISHHPTRMRPPAVPGHLADGNNDTDRGCKHQASYEGHEKTLARAFNMLAHGAFRPKRVAG